MNIPINDDSISEDAEDFSVMVSSNDSNVSFERSMVGVTIIDSDSVTIGFEMEVYSAMEGQMVEVCAGIREGALQRVVSVLLSTQDIDAEAPDDYSSLSIVLSFDSNSDRQCVNISIRNDPVSEGVEMFQVLLGSLEDSQVILLPIRAEIVIVDGDGKINIESEVP